MSILTARDVQTVNINKSAIPGRIYHSTYGITYQGTSARTLMPYQPAVSSSFIPTPTNKEVTVQKAIENLGNIVGTGSLKEIPLSSGAIDGVNTVFVWAHAPLLLMLNGQTLQKGGVGYTIVGTTTTLVNAPYLGDYLLAYGNY